MDKIIKEAVFENVEEIYDKMLNTYGSIVIAPLETITALLGEILAYDFESELIYMNIDKFAHEYDEYMLVYSPELCVSIAPFRFGMDRYANLTDVVFPVYIYDRCPAMGLDSLNLDCVTSFHFKEDEEEYEDDEDGFEHDCSTCDFADECDIKKDAETKVAEKTTVKETPKHKDEAQTKDDICEEDDDCGSHFATTWTDKDGNMTSYSFWSTDKELVHKMAEDVQKKIPLKK